MKKISLILIVSAVLFAGLFTSCGESFDVYTEDWYPTTGYVKYKDGTKTFEKFIEGVAGKPDGQPTAILWEHRYIKSPYADITPYTWNAEEIEYTEDPNLEDFSFNITNVPRTRNGLTFYCDDTNVYVVNDKYDTYRDWSRGDRDQYRFTVEVRGIKPLHMKMIKLSGSGSW